MTCVLGFEVGCECGGGKSEGGCEKKRGRAPLGRGRLRRLSPDFCAKKSQKTRLLRTQNERISNKLSTNH
jgi:hypothetical protein